DEIGEGIPMISWGDDNLSRFVVADGPSSAWGKGSPSPSVLPLPNHAVKRNDGIFLCTGAGENTSTPHPDGNGPTHTGHPGVSARLWDKGLVKIYVYRLEGVQMKSLLEKKR